MCYHIYPVCTTVAIAIVVYGTYSPPRPTPLSFSDSMLRCRVSPFSVDFQDITYIYPRLFNYKLITNTYIITLNCFVGLAAQIL